MIAVGWMRSPSAGMATPSGRKAPGLFLFVGGAEIYAITAIVARPAFLDEQRPGKLRKQR
jgi:hypothetical protein